MPDGKDARIVVVCGAGNNGGDGFAVARHLLSRGFDVHCFLTARSEKVTGDARINHDAYIDLGGEYTELPPDSDLGPLENELSRATMAVDALFGTGLARPIEGHLKDVIEVINQLGVYRVSLDIPSGLDADTGTPLGTSVHAHDTVTFGALKMGLLTPEGARLSGRVHVVDLGVPPIVLAEVGHVAEVIELRNGRVVDRSARGQRAQARCRKCARGGRLRGKARRSVAGRHGCASRAARGSLPLRRGPKP